MEAKFFERAEQIFNISNCKYRDISHKESENTSNFVVNYYTVKSHSWWEELWPNLQGFAFFFFFIYLEKWGPEVWFQGYR